MVTGLNKCKPATKRAHDVSWEIWVIKAYYTRVNLV